MRDKIIGVCESALGFSPMVMTENHKAYNEIDPLLDDQKNMFKYTAEKVTVDTKDNIDYFIEYSNNLERLMRDRNLTVDEAVEMVCEANDILVGSVTIVVDESCIDKVDIKAMSDVYSVRRI